MAIFMSSLYEKRMNGESVRSLIVLILDQYLKIMQITLKRIDNRRLKTDKIDVDKALNPNKMKLGSVNLLTYYYKHKHVLHNYKQHCCWLIFAPCCWLQFVWFCYFPAISDLLTSHLRIKALTLLNYTKQRIVFY